MATQEKTKWTAQAKTIALYLNEDQIMLLRQLAASEQTTVSELVRRAIRQVFFVPREDTESSQMASNPSGEGVNYQPTEEVGEGEGRRTE